LGRDATYSTGGAKPLILLLSAIEAQGDTAKIGGGGHVAIG
jgi:hypothetical protein